MPYHCEKSEEETKLHDINPAFNIEIPTDNITAGSLSARLLTPNRESMVRLSSCQNPFSLSRCLSFIQAITSLSETTPNPTRLSPEGWGLLWKGLYWGLASYLLPCMWTSIMPCLDYSFPSMRQLSGICWIVPQPMAHTENMAMVFCWYRVQQKHGIWLFSYQKSSCWVCAWS